MLRRPSAPCLALISLLLLQIACAKPAAGPAQFQANVPELLAKQSEELRQDLVKVTEGVYVAIGYGIANSIMIDAPEGRIIVDTMETVTQAQKVRAAFDQVSQKPIAAIIYTHNHPDHVYGAAAFDDSGKTPVYAHARTAALMDELVSIMRPSMNVRAAHMYGTLLEGPAFGNVGIGPFVGMFDASATLETRRPTVTFDERLSVTIAGQPLELIHAPGETEDQIYVWLPDRKVLLSGDNYYRSFPNLYTLRGTSWRDPVRWYSSLDKIRALEPEFLVPSHTRPLIGHDTIQQVITDYRDAIQYVHDQTIRGLNAGRTPDELAATIQLPAHLLASPYLTEFYGSVPWCVRAIYDGYVGWFDGNSTHLRPLPPLERAQHMQTLAGGMEGLQKQLAVAYAHDEWQWVLELTDIIRVLKPEDPEALRMRIRALKALGEKEINANARHWYYTEALELSQQRIATLTNNPTPALVHSIPTRTFFESLKVNLRAEDTLELLKVVQFHFPDTQEHFRVTLRRGILEVKAEDGVSADLDVTMNSDVWKEMLSGLRNPVAVMASGDIQATPGMVEFANFMRYFKAR